MENEKQILCKTGKSKMFLLQQFDVKWQRGNANLI